ncbi:MAG: hypothetical protein IJN44_00800, partial [Clostridia bacterium]|nr:hypothetical protein [Clostridia bacterium]
RIEQNYFRMLVKETKRNSTTGTMKTKKMPVGKACFPTGYFLLFSPDALHPVGGVPPPARGAAVPQPIRNDAIFFCKRVSACFVQGR